MSHEIVKAQWLGAGRGWRILCSCGVEIELASLHPRWLAVAERLAAVR